MKGIAIARPYAKALFSWAKESQSIDRWKNILSALGQLVNEAQIPSGLCGARWVSSILEEIFTADPHVKRFVELLAEREKFRYVPQIVSIFLAYCDDEEQIESIECTTAVELNDEQKAHFYTLLSQQMVCRLRLLWSVDPEIYSGIVIKHGSLVIDGSGLGRLQALEGAL